MNRAARICHGAAQEGQVLAPLDVVQKLLHALTGVPDFEVRRHHSGQGLWQWVPMQVVHKLARELRRGRTLLWDSYVL